MAPRLPSVPALADYGSAVPTRTAAAGGGGPPVFGFALGTPVQVQSPATTTVVLTTNVAIPAGALVVCGVSWYNAVTVSSVVAAGQALTQVSTRTGASDTNMHVSMYAAIHAAGAASAQSVTVTYSGNAFGRAIFGCYFTGTTATANAVSQNSATIAGGTSAAWSTGTAATSVANTAIVGVCALFGGGGVNTPGASLTDANDYADPANNGTWAQSYRIVSSTGSYGVTGTIAYTDVGGATEEWMALMAAFAGA